MSPENAKSPVKCTTCGGAFGGCSCGSETYAINKEYKASSSTTEQVLRDISSTFNTMTDIIDEMPNDLPIEHRTQNAWLRLRAQLIADMPEIVGSAVDYAQADPDIHEGVDAYSHKASMILREVPEGKTDFRLWHLLRSPLKHDESLPTSLDVLINDHFS